jgi:hypothetical protein
MTPVAYVAVVVGALVVHSWVLAFTQRGPFAWAARWWKRGDA